MEVATVIEKGALGPGEAASQIAKALSWKGMEVPDQLETTGNTCT